MFPTPHPTRAPKGGTVEITDWIRSHPVDEQLLWRGPAEVQMCFVRDDLARLFDEGDTRASVRVVSSHRSKSVELPVYYIRHRLMAVWLRGNFHNWILSVWGDGLDLSSLSRLDFARRLIDLNGRAEQVLGVYAEGFSEDWVFPPLTQAGERNAFSVYLPYNECVLFAFLYLLTDAFEMGLGTGS